MRLALALARLEHVASRFRRVACAFAQWPGKNRPWFACELRVTDAFKLELPHCMSAFVRQIPKYQGSIRLGVAHGIPAALLEAILDSPFSP